MAAADTLRVDVAILGGGIAGLWLLARLTKAGYSALLLECEALGTGQTIASQGIIHGGAKYEINFKAGDDSRALADMPARWRACLAGNGEVDLRGVSVASDRQLFWARRTLADRFIGFFGSRLMRGRLKALDAGEWPEALRDPRHVGAVYALDEIVLDVPDLLRVLSDRHAGRIKKIGPDMRIVEGGVAVQQDGGPWRRIEAATVIAAAGAGNEAILRQLGQPAEAAQRRPLQQVMLKNAPAPLWAHCFDASDKPRVTVTTHRRSDGALIWYIGGLLAETGATQSAADLIEAAKAELAALLPRLDFSRCRLATHRVDRAEGATADGRKPDGPVIREVGSVWLAWPTKLVLAPRLSDMIMAKLPPPSGVASTIPSDWAPPGIAAPPWETGSWN